MIARDALFRLARTLGGMPVLGCLPGTPAALAGVRYGDVLLSVNGRRTRSFAEYIEAKDLRADGMDLIVFRSGHEDPISLVYERDRPPPDAAAVLAEVVAMRVVPSERESGDAG